MGGYGWTWMDGWMEALAPLDGHSFLAHIIRYLASLLSHLF